MPFLTTSINKIRHAILYMTYTPRELVIFAGSLIAIIASIFNIATGAAGTGLYVSCFVILMFIIVIVMTLKNESKAEN